MDTATFRGVIHTATTIAFTLAAAAAFMACDDGLGTGNNGQLLTFPRDQIAFGTVDLGDVAREELRLTNEGSGDLTILDIRWDGSRDVALEFDGSDPGEFVLEPGDVFELEVAYAPMLDVIETGGDIVIESNDPDDPVVRVAVITQSLAPRIQVSPSRTQKLDFGAITTGDVRTRSVSITNFGALPLEITDIQPPANVEFSLEFPNGEVFPRDADPIVIEDSSQSFDFEVRYAPTSLGEDLGEITIISNDPREGVYLLPIAADSEAPCLLVKDEQVEFTPAVGIGAAATRNVLLESCGGVPVTIEAVEKVPGGSAAIIKNEVEPLAGRILEPGESTFFELVYAPQGEGVDTAEFTVRSNYTLRPEIPVTVIANATSNQCPVADAKARLRGSVLLEDQLSAIPDQVVVLDGTRSDDPDSEIAEYRWELRSAPADSTTSVVPGSESGLADLWLDLAGDYEVCLTVVDAQGVESCAEDCVQIRAQPSEKLLVQLIWTTADDPVVGDEDGTDVDLHFTRIPEGSWADSEWDIFFDNPEDTWNIAGGTPENPSLDRDDTDGEGPENVNFDDPNPCSWYAVGVHYFDDKGLDESAATVRIFVNGERRFEKNNIVLDNGTMVSGTFWQVALVHWDGETGRVFERMERLDNMWIGTAPTVPDQFQAQIESVAPNCAAP